LKKYQQENKNFRNKYTVENNKTNKDLIDSSFPIDNNKNFDNKNNLSNNNQTSNISRGNNLSDKYKDNYDNNINLGINLKILANFEKLN